MKFDLYNADCLEVMKDIPDGSIDAVICDPPYYYLYNQRWDQQWASVDEYIDWLHFCLKEIKRIIKNNGTCIMFTSQNLNHKVANLVEENMYLLCNMVWVKPDAAGAEKGLRSKTTRSPVNKSERILMFSPSDNPIGDSIESLLEKHRKTKRDLCIYCTGKYTGLVSNWLAPRNKHGACSPTENMWLKVNEFFNENIPYDSVNRYFDPAFLPYDIIEYGYVKSNHPCSKPLGLIEYFVKGLTKEYQTVLDFTMGSGTTGVACANTNRNFIGIELDNNYFNIAKERIEESYGKELV